MCKVVGSFRRENLPGVCICIHENTPEPTASFAWGTWLLKRRFWPLRELYGLPPGREPTMARKSWEKNRSCKGKGFYFLKDHVFLKLYRPGNLGKIPILSHIFEMGWGFTNNIPIADGKVKMYFGFSAKMLMRSSNLVGEHPRAFVGTASRRTSGK